MPAITGPVVLLSTVVPPLSKAGFFKVFSGLSVAGTGAGLAKTHGGVFAAKSLGVKGVAGKAAFTETGKEAITNAADVAAGAAGASPAAAAAGASSTPAAATGAGATSVTESSMILPFFTFPGLIQYAANAIYDLCFGEEGECSGNKGEEGKATTEEGKKQDTESVQMQQEKEVALQEAEKEEECAVCAVEEESADNAPVFLISSLAFAFAACPF